MRHHHDQRARTEGEVHRTGDALVVLCHHAPSPHRSRCLEASRPMQDGSSVDRAVEVRAEDSVCPGVDPAERPCAVISAGVDIPGYGAVPAHDVSARPPLAPGALSDTCHLRPPVWRVEIAERRSPGVDGRKTGGIRMGLSDIGRTQDRHGANYEKRQERRCNEPARSAGSLQRRSPRRCNEPALRIGQGSHLHGVIPLWRVRSGNSTGRSS